MLPDKMVQLGKKINRYSEETNTVTRYISRNLSSVEKSSDMVGVLYPYKLEFRTYSGASAQLTISFDDRFRKI